MGGALPLNLRLSQPGLACALCVRRCGAAIVHWGVDRESAIC